MSLKLSDVRTQPKQNIDDGLIIAGHPFYDEAITSILGQNMGRFYCVVLSLIAICGSLVVSPAAADSKTWKNNRPDGKYEYGFKEAFIKFVNFTSYPLDIQLYRPKSQEEGLEKLSFYILAKADFTSKAIKENSIFFVFRGDDFTGDRQPCVPKFEINVKASWGPETFTYLWDPADTKGIFFCKRRGTELKNIFGKRPIFTSKDYAGYYVAAFEKDGRLLWWYGQDIPSNTEKVLGYVRDREALIQKRGTAEKTALEETDDLKKKMADTNNEKKKGELQAKIIKTNEKAKKEVGDYTSKLSELDAKNAQYWEESKN